MEQDQIAQILNAIQTTARLQAEATDQVNQKLEKLASRLEPLAPVLEGLIAGFDGTVGRLETVTLAQAEMAKVSEEILAYLREAEREAEQRQHHPTI